MKNPVYSFAPLPPVDTLNDHTGLYVIVFFATWILVTIFFADNDSFPASLLAGLTVIVCATLVSFNTGSITTYANEPVRGTLVAFVAEGYNESRSSGKTTRRVDVHKTYVVYQVGDRRVLFDASPGVEYPNVATLYRN